MSVHGSPNQRGVQAKGRLAGFTLLELLVVMVILALMVGLVPPLFSGALPSARLKGAARELMAGLHYARSEAIRTNTPVDLDLDVARLEYRIGREGRLHRIPRGVDVGVESLLEVDRQPERYRMRFFPDGSSTGGVVSLALVHRRYLVEVDWLLGRVRLYEEALSAR